MEYCTCGHDFDQHDPRTFACRADGCACQYFDEEED